jgi:hypothetical protein
MALPTRATMNTSKYFVVIGETYNDQMCTVFMSKEGIKCVSIWLTKVIFGVEEATIFQKDERNLLGSISTQ